MKIVSTGATLASPGFLEKKQKARRRRRVIYSTLLFVIIAGLFTASRLESLRIGAVSVTGAMVIPKDDVTKVARELMNEKYLWIIPKDNALVYPQEKIREVLYRKFPRFNSVALSVAGFETLEIGVTEREPFALYCVKNATPCYFMDDSGFVFDLAPTFSDGVYLTYAGDAAPEEALGSQFLSPEDFKALASFVAHFPALGLEPISIEKRAESFSLELDNGVSVLWSANHDMNRVSSNLESFLNSPEIKSQKDFLEKVAELDLRTEDKVFYRFRE
jgi:cell division septal protein FtsQ